MQLKIIIPGELYQWSDVSRFHGLEDVSDLDLVSKRQKLFGSNDVDRYLTTEHTGSTHILIGTYTGLELETSDVNKIFIPECFLDVCAEFKKYFDQSWSWPTQRSHAVSCCFHKSRYLRIISSCWLANHAHEIDFIHTQNWKPEDHILSCLYELLQIGGLKDWTGSWGPDLLQLPKKIVGQAGQNGFIDDFFLLNDAVYSKAASCVITGGITWEYGSEIDEKYLYAVYAGCIPLVAGYGAYDRLQAMGFDVFDDIIDTSSQWDRNPISAIWNLWEHNRNFFSNAKNIAQDPLIQHRLRANLCLARDIKQLNWNSYHNLNDDQAKEIMIKHWGEPNDPYNMFPPLTSFH